MSRIVIAIPTIHQGPNLEACLESLRTQTFRDFDIHVIDNRANNIGYGAAINLAIRKTDSEFVLALNDDTVAHADFLAELIAAAERNPEAGMFAPCIRLHQTGLLDSAGMLLGPDGSSKQRGRLQPPDGFDRQLDTLFPSGCAALYRRAMLNQIGLFDESFFLYCEDTDLGLRALRSGFPCRYVPLARVEHRYSASATTALKAYLVERNRLRVALHHFPLSMLLRAPLAAMERYYWHTRYPKTKSLSTVQSLAAVLRAHLALAPYLLTGLQRRKEAAALAKLTPAEFIALAKRHAISPREIAEQAAR